MCAVLSMTIEGCAGSREMWWFFVHMECYFVFVGKNGIGRSNLSRQGQCAERERGKEPNVGRQFVVAVARHTNNIDINKQGSLIHHPHSFKTFLVQRLHTRLTCVSCKGRVSAASLQSLQKAQCEGKKSFYF